MAKETKQKQTTICQCGATHFHGPTQIVEFVGGVPVVLEETWRCVNCHREYTAAQIADLGTRTTELPAG